jgi:hypothetical protein
MQANWPGPTLGDVIAWLQRHPAWAGVLSGGLLGGVIVMITALSLRHEQLDAIAYPCAAVAGGAFAVRRSYPVVTLALAAAATTVYGATGQPGGPIYLTVYLAAINLAARRPTRTWLPWTVAAAAGLVAGDWSAKGFTFHQIPAGLLLVALPALAGDAVRQRRLRMETLEARVNLAEQETLRRVAEERLRIAATAWRRSRCARALPIASPIATRPRSAPRCGRSGRSRASR